MKLLNLTRFSTSDCGGGGGNETNKVGEKQNEAGEEVSESESGGRKMEESDTER